MICTPCERPDEFTHIWPRRLLWTVGSLQCCVHTVVQVWVAILILLFLYCSCSRVRGVASRVCRLVSECPWLGRLLKHYANATSEHRLADHLLGTPNHCYYWTVGTVHYWLVYNFYNFFVCFLPWLLYDLYGPKTKTSHTRFEKCFKIGNTRVQPSNWPKSAAMIARRVTLVHFFF